MKNVDRVLRHVIVRTDLEQKRADKLAKRNPKKERVRPAAPVCRRSGCRRWPRESAMTGRRRRSGAAGVRRNDDGYDGTER